MKPGAVAFICTPFLQAFHGYPSHFQNFTLVGHKLLFERAEFTVLDSGVCVGPAYALGGIIAVFIREYTPHLLRWPVRVMWYILGNMLRPLDRWLSARPNAYIVASTTYVLVSKSSSPAKAI